MTAEVSSPPKSSRDGLEEVRDEDDAWFVGSGTATWPQRADGAAVEEPSARLTLAPVNTLRGSGSLAGAGLMCDAKSALRDAAGATDAAADEEPAAEAGEASALSLPVFADMPTRLLLAERADEVAAVTGSTAAELVDEEDAESTAWLSAANATSSAAADSWSTDVGEAAASNEACWAGDALWPAWLPRSQSGDATALGSAWESVVSQALLPPLIDAGPDEWSPKAGERRDNGACGLGAEVSTAVDGD